MKTKAQEDAHDHKVNALISQIVILAGQLALVIYLVSEVHVIPECSHEETGWAAVFALFLMTFFFSGLSFLLGYIFGKNGEK